MWQSITRINVLLLTIRGGISEPDFCRLFTEPATTQGNRIPLHKASPQLLSPLLQNFWSKAGLPCNYCPIASQARVGRTVVRTKENELVNTY